MYFLFNKVFSKVNLKGKIQQFLAVAWIPKRCWNTYKSPSDCSQQQGFQPREEKKRIYKNHTTVKIPRQAEKIERKYPDDVNKATHPTVLHSEDTINQSINESKRQNRNTRKTGKRLLILLLGKRN